jgi:ArsR family transcriptional regulator, virulence genes transcriptional regulator
MAILAIRNPRDFEAKAAEAAALLDALANPRRLMILCELAQGERSVGALVRAVGLQQAAVSQHLAKLRRAGVVTSRPEAQMAFYRLKSPAAVAVINTLSTIFCPPYTRKMKR